MDPPTPESKTANPRLLRRALLVSFALYVTLGLPDGVLGTVWPTLRDDFGRADSSFGLLIACSAVGYTSSSIGSGHLTQRYGSGLVLRNASFAAIAGLGLLSVAPTWWTSMLGVLVLGAGWGLCDASVNAWMALTQGPRQMGLLHAAYGVGALSGPLLATAFIANGGLWRGPFMVICGLGVVLVAVIASARHGFDTAPVSSEVAGAPAPTRGSRMLLTLLIVWFSIYVGIEVTVGQWSYTLLTESRDHNDVFASVLVAAFWGGLTLGRFLLAGFGDRFSPERVPCLDDWYYCYWGGVLLGGHCFAWRLRVARDRAVFGGHVPFGHRAHGDLYRSGTCGSSGRLSSGCVVGRVCGYTCFGRGFGRPSRGGSGPSGYVRGDLRAWVAVDSHPGSVVACDGFGLGLSLDGLSRPFGEIGSESREVAGIQHALPNARSVGDVVGKP